MGKAASTIGVSVTARTEQYVAGMKKAERATKRLGVATVKARSNLALMGSRLALIAGTAIVFGIVTTFAKATVAVEKFNQAMTNSLAIMGRVSQAMQRDMRRAALDLSKTTIFTGEQLGKAFFFLASAGLDAKRSIEALPAVARFAQAGMFDLSLATDLLTDAQTAFGLTVKDSTKNLENMVRVSDNLVGANKLAQATVQQFAQALANKAAASLRMNNVALEEGVAVLAAFAQNGKKGSEAGTALAIVIRDLTTKTIKNTEAFEKFKIEVFDTTTGALRLIGAIRDIEQALEGLTPRAKKTRLLELGFNDKSLQFIQTILGSSGEMERFLGILKEMGGITEEISNKQLTPFIKGWKQLTGALAVAAQPLQFVIDRFGDLMLLLGKGVEFATGAGARFIEGLAVLPMLARVLLGLAPIIGKAKDPMDEVADATERATEEVEKLAKSLRRLPMGERPAFRGGGTDSDSRTRRLIQLGVRTPSEIRQQGKNRLDRFFGAGGVEDPETYARAIEELNKDFEDATGVTAFTDSIMSTLDSLKTPAEQFKKTIGEIRKAVELGILTPDEASQARRRLLNQAAGDLGGVGGVKDSRELGLTSISTVGGAAGALALSKGAKVQDRELKELKMQTELLRQQNQLIAQGGMGP